MTIDECRKSADDNLPRLAIEPWLRQLLDASRAARNARTARYGQAAGATVEDDE